MKFVEKLDKFLNDLTSMNCPTVITGDFNIDTLANNELKSNYLCTITSNDFELANLETTRETSNSATCLDHFIYQNFTNPEFKVLTHENFSDHYPILMNWQVNVDTEENYLPFRDISFKKRSKTVVELFNRLRLEPKESMSLS